MLAASSSIAATARRPICYDRRFRGALLLHRRGWVGAGGRHHLSDATACSCERLNFGEHDFHEVLTLSSTPSASLGHHCPSQRESGPQVVLCFGIAWSPRLPSWSR